MLNSFANMIKTGSSIIALNLVEVTEIWPTVGNCKTSSNRTRFSESTFTQVFLNVRLKCGRSLLPKTLSLMLKNLIYLYLS